MDDAAASPRLAQLQGSAVSLAPMVRCGSLPLRALALEYGAAAVYSEETIAHALAETTRHVDARGYVEFVATKTNAREPTVVLRTHPALERSRLVVQLGAADGPLALRAAEQVAGDCAGIDINMGCPKAFSVHGGMGAALLKTPERAADIVRTLSRNLPTDGPNACPVSVKVMSARVRTSGDVSVSEPPEL